MTKDLTPQSFIECWKSFTEENSDALFSAYESNTEMTRRIIGKCSKGEDPKTLSPFGDFFKKEFSNGYEYRREDGSIDLAIYKPECIGGLKNMNPDDKAVDLGWLLPKFYHILIEHENECLRAFEEMHKLTYYRSTLKVLITYNWNPSPQGDKWDYVHDRLCQNFMEIIRQSNESFRGSNFVHYLLILGQKIDNKLIWKYSVFTVKEDGEADIVALL